MFPAPLAGLLTAGGKYSAAEWQQLCDINPLQWPQYFKEVNGKIYCTMQYRVEYELYMLQIHNNFSALGVRS